MEACTPPLLSLCLGSLWCVGIPSERTCYLLVKNLNSSYLSQRRNRNVCQMCIQDNKTCRYVIPPTGSIIWYFLKGKIVAKNFSLMKGKSKIKWIKQDIREAYEWVGGVKKIGKWGGKSKAERPNWKFSIDNVIRVGSFVGHKGQRLTSVL